MVDRSFLKSGHTPTLFSAFLYFDLSFMTWVLLGPLGVAISKSFGLSPAQKGFMVAVPVLSGAVLRLFAGVMVDHIGPKRTGLILQLLVLAGLGAAWLLGVHSYNQVLILGLLLGVAGASFAVRAGRKISARTLSNTPLTNLPLSDVENFLAMSTASLMLTTGGISSRCNIS